MPHAATRCWTVPLSALLLFNTALVATAFWRVGFGNDSQPAPPAATPDSGPAAVVVDGGSPAEAVNGADKGENSPQPVAAGETTIATAAGDAPGTSPAAETAIEPWGDETLRTPPPVVIDVITDASAPAAASSSTITPEATDRVQERPSAAAAPPAAQPSEEPASLVIINPPTTGGAVHFLVGAQIFSLAPGELQRLPGSDSYRVRFHRGDDLGDADERCLSGVYVFAVDVHGWTLNAAEEATADRLQKVCVPVVASYAPSLD